MMIERYKRRPSKATIAALKFEFSGLGVKAVKRFAGGAFAGTDRTNRCIWIRGCDGREYKVLDGDYIVKGPHEFYAIPSKIFPKIYERLEKEKD